MKLPYLPSPCIHCPFRLNTLKGWLGNQRIKGILDSPSFVCHKKTAYQCAGHMLMRGNRNIFVATASAMKIPLNISGEDLVFGSEEECIKYHTGEGYE